MKTWSDDAHQLLRIYPQGADGEEVVQLSTDTERAIAWVENLSQRTFIGTESRFLQIFALLEEIAIHSTDDVEARISQLERQRDAIQSEIDRIRETGQTKRLTPTQIRERFNHANEVARQLISDFTAVEQNFRQLARSVQQAQLQPDARKGAVLESVLDADAQLKESDEGRSFYAFWQFLMSPTKQDELRTLLDAAYTLPELQDEIVRERSILRHVTRHLLDWGEKIVQSNQRLAEQLRRMLDERNIAEMRRVRELIRDIQYAAMQRVNDPPEDEEFITLEGDPEVLMPMEKSFWQPPETLQFSRQPPHAADTTLSAADLLPLYNPHVVDESVLRQHIEVMLSERGQVMLPELLVHFPTTKGLAEILAYMALASRDSRHEIDSHAHDLVQVQPVGGGTPYGVNVPRIIFRKSKHES